MTNAQLGVILATALDKAPNPAAASRVMKRYALAQALAVEEQLSDDDTRIISAAAALYDLNDESVNPHDTEGDEAFKPIVITGYIKDLLDDANLPVFEASAVGSLVAMQKHGHSIENNLHRLLQDIDTLVALDEKNADTAEARAALERLSHPSAKRRLAQRFGLDAE